MNESNYYENLIKPDFAPPSWLFGPVWSILYTVIFLTYGYIIYCVIKGKYPRKILVPLLFNLLFNVIFTPIQFGLKNNFLAAIDISLVLITLVWLFKMLYKQSKILAFLQVPYLIWVSFATILQFSITWLNK